MVSYFQIHQVEQQRMLKGDNTKVVGNDSDKLPDDESQESARVVAM